MAKDPKRDPEKRNPGRKDKDDPERTDSPPVVEPDKEEQKRIDDPPPTKPLNPEKDDNRETLQMLWWE